MMAAQSPNWIVSTYYSANHHHGLTNLEIHRNCFIKIATAYRTYFWRLHVNKMFLYRDICVGHWLPNIHQLIIPYLKDVFPEVTTTASFYSKVNMGTYFTKLNSFCYLTNLNFSYYNRKALSKK